MKKNTQATAAATPSHEAGPSKEDLLLARRIHTLAHVVYGQLAASATWPAQGPAGYAPGPALQHGPGGWSHPAPYVR